VIGPLEALEGRQLLSGAVGYDLPDLLSQLVVKNPAPATQVQAQPVVAIRSTAASPTVSASVVSNTGVIEAPAAADVPPEFAAAKADALAHSRQVGGPVAYLSGTLTGKAQGIPGTITLQQGSGALATLGKSTLNGTIDFWNGTGQLVVVGSKHRALLLQVKHVQYKPSPATRSLAGDYVYRLQVGYRTADGTVTGPASGVAVITVSLTKSAAQGYAGGYNAKFYPTLG
jgi:hypothetical protein